MSWKKVKLGDILNESKIISENPNPDRRITVRLKVLGVEKRGLENEVEGATKQYIRKAGQFIYGKQNFHKGAFGIIPPELDGFESSSDLPAFDVDDSCLPEFIFYFFKQGNFYLELSKIASGVATQRINTTQLFALELLLPEIKIQRQLISNIQSLEKNGSEISTELTHQLSLVKKLRQQLLQDAVQGKLVAQDPTDEPASELLKKIKAEKEKLIAEKKLKKEKELPPIKPEEIPFEIPENWVWCRLGEIVNLVTSGSRDWAKYYSSEGDIFVRMGNLSRESYSLRMDKIQYVKPPKNQEGNRTKLEADDILISITGEVGNLGLIPKDFGEAYINQHTSLVRLNKAIVVKYICNLFLSKTLQEQFNAPQRGMKNSFRLSDIDYLLIPLPPFTEQNRIVEKLDELMQYCNDLEGSIKESETQNEKLLQQVLREALRKDPVEA